MDSCLPVEYFLKQWNAARFQDKERDSHWPSEASLIVDGKVVGACLRSLYYKWTKEPETNPNDVKSFWNFYAGKMFEDLYEEGLKLLGQEYQREVAFRADIGLKYPISGKMDFLVKDCNQWSAIEIKSAYGRGMDAVKKAGQPKDGYLLQMLSYLTYGEPRPSWCYNPTFARDSFFRLQFHVMLEEGKLMCDGRVIPFTMEGIIKRWAELEKAVADKQLPNRDFEEPKKYPCSYCNWAKKCWEGIQ